MKNLILTLAVFSFQPAYAKPPIPTTKGKVECPKAGWCGMPSKVSCDQLEAYSFSIVEHENEKYELLVHTSVADAKGSYSLEQHQCRAKSGYARGMAIAVGIGIQSRDKKPRFASCALAKAKTFTTCAADDATMAR